MSEFPSLESVLAQHSRRIDPNHPAYGACRSCGFDPDVTPGTKDFAAHLADAWRSACEVRTVEQLDALPDGVILLGPNGNLTVNKLPALVIWHPSWVRP
jgi:hypothetical protein